MKELHEEWFPFDYPQHFYDRMGKRNYLAMGCFYKVEMEDDYSEEVMIGCMFSRIERETRKNEDLLAKIDEPRWNRQTWLERARELLSFKGRQVIRADVNHEVRRSFGIRRDERFQ